MYDGIDSFGDQVSNIRIPNISDVAVVALDGNRVDARYIVTFRVARLAQIPTDETSNTGDKYPLVSHA